MVMKSLEFIEELVTRLEDFQEGVKETWKSEDGQFGKLVYMMMQLSESHVKTLLHMKELIKQDMTKSN